MLSDNVALAPNTLEDSKHSETFEEMLSTSSRREEGFGCDKVSMFCAEYNLYKFYTYLQ